MPQPSIKPETVTATATLRSEDRRLCGSEAARGRYRGQDVFIRCVNRNHAAGRQKVAMPSGCGQGILSFGGDLICCSIRDGALVEPARYAPARPSLDVCQ